MIWELSHRADQKARVIADRHYNRQKPGTPQFVPPGRCFVLKQKRAVWVSSWPFAQYVKHQWAGAWVNSLFRRQGGRQIASEMIRDAVAATRYHWPAIPELGMITFVDEGKVRKKTNPGRCYIEAGFTLVGKTKGGLLAFQMLPANMPEPKPAIGEPMTNEEAKIDTTEAQERLDKILSRERALPISAGFPTPPTHPPAPKTDYIGGHASTSDYRPAPNRKPRSDKGVPKNPPADPDEITLKLTLTEARMVALGDPDFGISAKIQDQIIAQLQKRLDALNRSK